MIVVDLRTHTRSDPEPPRNVYLREVSGFDELWNGPADELINQLLVDWPGAVALPGDAGKFTLAEIDRVLATVYRSLYGDEVECYVSCSACRYSYSLSFTLTDMWRSLTETTTEDEALLSELTGPDERGAYRLGGFSFRLPTGDDLAAVAGLAQAEIAGALRARCVFEDDRAVSDETLDRVMSLTGPTLDTDLDGLCPECGAEEQIPFRIDEFLLAALRRESPMLTREVHHLARAYRWSRREILEMPRRERRQYAGLILAEVESGGGWA
jgi:hypothetical protein